MLKKIILLATCVILSTTHICVASNPPAPSAGVTQEVQKQKSTSHEQMANSEQSPSQLNPLVGSQSRCPTEQNKDTSNYKQNGNEWASPDGWTARWTGLLFGATLLLWIFTALMWLTTSKAVSDGHKAFELAQKEFNATHRPRIAVYAFGTEVVPKGIGDYFISVSIRNCGESSAKITKIGSYNVKVDAANKVNPFRNDRFIEFEVDEILAAGSEARITTKSIFDMSSGPKARWADGVLELFLMGFVEYEDMNGVKRRTGFCRQWTKHGTWERQTNNEYEYQD